MEIISADPIMYHYKVDRKDANVHKRMLARILMNHLNAGIDKDSRGLRVNAAWTDDEVIREISNCKSLDLTRHWMHNSDSDYKKSIWGVKFDLGVLITDINQSLHTVMVQNPSLRLDSTRRIYAGRMAIALESGCKHLAEAARYFPAITPATHTSIGREIWEMLTEPGNVYEPVQDSTFKQITWENETMNQSHSGHPTPAPLFERVALIRGNRADQYSNEQLIGFIKEAEDRIKTLGEVKTKSTYIDAEVASLESAVKEIAALLDSRIAA